MEDRVFRSINQPIREDCAWDERWRGQDKGLIQCWETGRKLGDKHPELRRRAKSGELPVLNWKGGVEVKLKAKFKYGTLQYLAQWQGLREDDLDIDTSCEVEMICSRTQMKIVFTADSSKYAIPEMS